MMIYYSIITACVYFAYSFGLDYQDDLNISQYVQFQTAILRKLGNSTAQGVFNWDFSQPFINQPKIITGISLYNNQQNFMSVDFSVTTSTINKQACTVNLNFNENKYGPKTQVLYSLDVSILAIDTTSITNIFVSDLILLQIDITKLKKNNYILEFPLQYKFQQSNLDKSNIAIFLNGFDAQQVSYPSSQKLNLKIDKEILDTEFKIKFISTSDSIKINSVYIQYIEYLETSNSNFIAEIIDHSQFTNNGASTKLSDNQDGRVDFQKLKLFQVSSTLYEKVLFGINEISIDFELHSRLRINNQLFTDTSLTIQYESWHGSYIYGVRSNLILIGLRKCKDNAQYFFQNSCYKDCQVQANKINFNSNNYCNCKDQIYYYPSLKITDSKIIDGNYCTTIQQNCYQCDPCTDLGCSDCKQDQSVCNSCKPGYYFEQNTCKQCQSQNCKSCSTTKCLQCLDTYYLLDGNCTQSQPPNSFCDSTTHVCKNCNSGCSKCSDPTSTTTAYTCDSCITNYYKLGQNCTIDKPDNTYCDKIARICDICQDINCKDCDTPNTSPQTCLTCNPNQYKLEGKCTAQKPPNTFCQGYECKLCNNNCSTCNDPDITTNFVCNSCINNFYLYQGKCTQIKPEPTFCTEVIIKTIPPNTYKTCEQCLSTCQKCVNKIECTECNPDHFFFDKKCTSQQPDFTYCSEDKKECQPCLSKQCQFCKKDRIECIQCIETLNLSNGLCTCTQLNEYYDTTSKKCEKCDSPCISCYNTSTSCLTCGLNAVQKQIPTTPIPSYTCVCQDENQYIDKQTNNCLSCPKDQILINTENNNKQCKCIQPGYYIDKTNKKCTKCNIKYCLDCNPSGQTCDVCQPGYKRMEGNYKQCGYCNEGIYADNNGICQNRLNCKEGCTRCTNSNDCQIFEENHVFKDKDCHYTCSECHSLDQFDCLKCSSENRIYNPSTKSCPCKEGLINQFNKKNCIQDTSELNSSKFKTARENMMNAVYFLYFPQLFMNIHPFGDAFIFSLQLLGNTSLLSKDEQPLSQFTIYNYFNILYSSSSDSSQPSNESNLAINRQLQESNNNSQEPNNIQTTSKKQINVVFIKYKTVIDIDIFKNILILLAIYYLCIVLFILASILRKCIKNKQTCNWLQKSWYWNGQLKIIRISSNYLILNTIIHYKNFSENQFLSKLLLPTMLIIYIANLIITYHQSSQSHLHCYDSNDSSKSTLSLNSNITDPSYFQFLHTNLDQKLLFHRYFWFFFEILKLILAISLSFIPLKFHYYLIIMVSFILIMLFVRQKPGGKHVRDTLYLVFNQLFLISISSIQVVAQQQYENNLYDQLQSLQQLSDILSFLFCLFQYLYIAEYLFRTWRNKSNRYRSSSNLRKSQEPIFQQMPQTIDYSQLQDILNNSSSSSSTTTFQMSKKSLSYKYKKSLY